MVPQAVGAWVGDNRLQLNPGKMDWIWVYGASGSRHLSFLVLDGMALPQTDLVHNLVFFLDSRLLLKKQVAIVARRCFTQLHVVH